MKRTKQCPKCQSLKIGYLPSQPDAEDVITTKFGGTDKSLPSIGGPERSLASRALGLSTETVQTGYAKYGTMTPLLGRLEAYVCTACGYHETYVAEPANIPWEKLVGFAWVNEGAAADGPYR